MPTSETFPFAPQTPHAVGRDRELQAIKRALESPGGETAILYFIGPGGIGKTRLIEEGAKLAPPSVLVSPVIDLYHAEAHSVAGLQQLLADGLDHKRSTLRRTGQKARTSKGDGPAGSEFRRRNGPRLQRSSFRIIRTSPRSSGWPCASTPPN